MSRARVSLGALLCAAVVIVTASPAGGQTVEAYRARIEQLSEILDEIEQERQEQERLRNEQLMSRLDTLRVGRLRLITTPEYAAKVERTARLEWEKVEPAISAASPGAAGEEFVFYFGLPYPPEPGIVELEGSVQRAIGRTLAARLDPDSAFIRQLPFEPLERVWREAVYVALATADSRSAKFCFLGDLTSCRDLLGLTELSDPFTVWYTAEERHRAVSGRSEFVTGSTWKSCVEDGSDDACLEYLREWGAAPVPPDARRMLLDVTLELGGEGTYARLSTSSGSNVEERLAAAAAVEPDTLITRWREAVLEARPRTQAVSGLEGLVALAWIVGLTVVATRSSRWRLG